MWGDSGQGFTYAVEMFLLTWGSKGRERQETQAGMTLLSLLLLIRVLCSYSPYISLMALSDGSPTYP